VSGTSFLRRSGRWCVQGSLRHAPPELKQGKSANHRDTKMKSARKNLCNFVEVRQIATCKKNVTSYFFPTFRLAPMTRNHIVPAKQLPFVDASSPSPTLPFLSTLLPLHETTQYAPTLAPQKTPPP
jgi:hypothetical protein